MSRKKLIDNVTEMCNNRRPMTVAKIQDLLFDHDISKMGSRSSLAGKLSSDPRWDFDKKKHGAALWYVKRV